VLKNSNDVEHVRETENFYKQPVLKFSSLNPSDGISFSINKPQFKIGKKATIVDGAISFNNAISRVHCQVEYKNNKFYIVDLNSANGTYLNKHKLDSNKLYELKNKDNIRLANSDFIVEF
jgi:pSer/pThr/pTyr-binding forkhead associated (FHA) protein